MRLICMEMNLLEVRFYMNGFPRGPAFTWRQKATRKWVFPRMNTISLSVHSKRSVNVAKRIIIEHLYKTLHAHNAAISAQSCD